MLEDHTRQIGAAPRAFKVATKWILVEVLEKCDFLNIRKHSVLETKSV